MHGRVMTVTVQGISDQKFDEAVANYREIVPPKAKLLEGFEKAILLVDRENDQVLSLTLWRDKDCCDAGIEQSGKLAQEVMQKTGIQGDVRMNDYEVPVFSE